MAIYKNSLEYTFELYKNEVTSLTNQIKFHFDMKQDLNAVSNAGVNWENKFKKLNKKLKNAKKNLAAFEYNNPELFV